MNLWDIIKKHLRGYMIIFINCVLRNRTFQLSPIQREVTKLTRSYLTARI
jgi:hypothetical protein